MSRAASIFWTTARVLLGLYFVAATIMVIVMLGGDHPPEAVPAAADLTGALNRSGFMNPLLIASFLLGGAALMFDRAAPVGLLLLAPAVVVIGCFHWFLTGRYIWGSVWPIWWAVVAWDYRHVFARLWERRPAA